MPSAKPKASKAEAPVIAKRGKSKKEGAVKKAPSAYIIFCTEKRPQVKIDNPNASFGELGKLLGKLWADLSEEEKEVRISLF